MNKRGQFYLVAAIIITVIITSLVVVSNYSKKDETSDLTSLRQELVIESSKAFDYGINNNLNQVQMHSMMINFTKNYVNVHRGDKNLYFIFGKDTNITLSGYQKSSSRVVFNDNIVTAGPGDVFTSVDPATNSINLTIDSNTYLFSLTQGENFYFVVSREGNGGNYVITG